MSRAQERRQSRPTVARSSRRAGIGLVPAMMALTGAGMLLVAFSAAIGWQFGAAAGLVAGLVALLLGLAIAAWAGRRIASALTAITCEAEALRDLDASRAVNRPIRVASGIVELDRLDDAMRQMKQALGLFGLYIPRDLVRQLVAQGAEVRLGGERRQLTVLFSDVEDFTRIAEPLDPEALMRIASTYFEALTVELLRHGATVDKYIGDAVMAMWNAPRRDLAHAMHACHAALHLRRIAAELAGSFAARGWPPLPTRFGLHSGEAVVGNVGSSDRMNYAAIGSMVNLASRVEGLNKRYGTAILVSEATLRGAGSAFVTRPVDLVTPKGIGDAIEVHELIGLVAARSPEDAPLVAGRALMERLPHWREMIRCYRARNFAAATEALDRFGGAGVDPVAALYARRLERLLAEPPGAEWAPVVAYADK